MKLLVNFESLYPSLPLLTWAVPVLPKMFHVLLRARVAVPRTTTSHNTRRTSIAVAGSSHHHPSSAFPPRPMSSATER